MSDIIRLLPDSVANQIAAGEVIQRPASAVKELLENAIDSGATSIKLIIKDAGKTLIQLIDNGSGMSVTDLRMSVERHATSKIRHAADLFAIRTMGFRGEALASIAAISQLEIKSRRSIDELGTQLNIDGSEVINQEAVQCTSGTSVSIKNLFFNVPARRNFLKSSQVETRHIIDEFIRVAMVNHDISFTMHHNDKLVFQLNNSNLKQRITALLGAQYSQRLVAIEQKTDLVRIWGFIGKPEFARKTRGEQFFFANNRYIRHPYLHHSVDSAFKELISTDSFPTYFIFIEVDPKTIDINIHPTKTEVNFQDNKLIYGVLRAAIRQSLGQYNITPSLDFDIEKSLDFTEVKPGQIIKPPQININPDYNPFTNPVAQKSHNPASSSNNRNWEDLYTKNTNFNRQIKSDFNINTDEVEANNQGKILDKDDQINNEKIFQFKNSYLITTIKSGIIVVDQNRAHERILFEKYDQLIQQKHEYTQKELYPQTINFSFSDSEIILEIKKELQRIGFDIEHLGQNTFVLTGRPADLKDQSIKDSIEGIIENYKKNLLDINLNKKINLAKAMAENMAIKRGKLLQKEEQNILIGQLFACRIPELSPSGKKVFKILSVNEIENLL